MSPIRRTRTALTALCRSHGRTIGSVADALGIPARSLYQAAFYGTVPDELAGRVAAELGVTLDELRVAVPERTRPAQPRAFQPHYEAIASLGRASVSHGALAQSLGISNATVSAYLHGWNKPPERFVARVEELAGEPREVLFPQLFEVDVAEFGADETDGELA